jgi:hypothetical protein
MSWRHDLDHGHDEHGYVHDSHNGYDRHEHDDHRHDGRVHHIPCDDVKSASIICFHEARGRTPRLWTQGVAIIIIDP